MLMLLASPIAALTTTAVLKDDFRLLAARNDRGFSASASTIARLQAMATELEAATDSEGFAPTASETLLGKWDLDFCDAGDVLSLGLLPLPLGSRIGNIYQEIASGSASNEFVVQNGVEITPPGLISAAFADAPPLVYEVEARCKTLDATRVSLAFVGGRVRPPLLPSAVGGVLPDALITQVQQAFGERVFLQTTYLDEDFRVARGPGKELYVLSKR